MSHTGSTQGNADSDPTSNVDTSLSSRQRTRKLTEKGMNYHADNYEREFSVAVKHLKNALEECETLLCDEDQSLSHLLLCRDNLVSKFEKLNGVQEKFGGLGIPTTSLNLQVIDELTLDYNHKIKSLNERSGDVRMETQSNASCRSGSQASSVASRMIRMQKEAKLARLKTEMEYKELENQKRVQLQQHKAELERLEMQKELDATRAELQVIDSLEQQQVDEAQSMSLAKTGVNCGRLLDASAPIFVPQSVAAGASYQHAPSAGNFGTQQSAPVLVPQSVTAGTSFQRATSAGNYSAQQQSVTGGGNDSGKDSIEGTLTRLANLLSGQQSQSRLPSPEPEVFDGDRLQFALWLDLFENMIEANVRDRSDCLPYLIKYTAGEAREVIKGFAVVRSVDSYNRAKALLKERYGDPYTTFNAFRDKLDKWPKLQAFDGSALMKFSDFLQHCLSMTQCLPSLRLLDDPRENQRLLQKLPGAIVNRWAQLVDKWRMRRVELTDNGESPTPTYSVYPPFSEFCSFIKREARLACDPITSAQALRSVVVDRSTKITREVRSKSTSKDTHVNFSTRVENTSGYRQERRLSEVVCAVCSKPHEVDKCDQLHGATISDRHKIIKEKGLCFCCLGRGHRSSQCRTKRRCSKCQGRHSTLLHYEKEAVSITVGDGNVAKKQDVHAKRETDKKTADTSGIAASQASGTNGASAIVQTVDVKGRAPVSHSLIVPVWLHRQGFPESRRMVYAVLDDQSDATFISEECLEALGAPYVELDLQVSTIIGEDTVHSKRVDDLVVQSYMGGKAVSLPSTFSMENIASKRGLIPRVSTAERWPHLAPMAHYLMPYDSNIGVDLLIGTDCPEALKPVSVIPGRAREPYAVETLLGWGVIGRVHPPQELDASGSSLDRVCFRTQVRTKEMILPPDLKMPGINLYEDESGKAFSHEDFVFLRTMDEKVVRLKDGRYQAPLPFRNPDFSFPKNKDAVLRRTLKLKHRLSNDSVFKEAYCDFMDEIMRMGYAQEVSFPSSEEEGSCWYVPHHAVSPKDRMDKFRIVFDCSATYGGVSLNQNLLQGPDLTGNLVGLLLRFREEPVVVGCDIRKMFYQVKVKPGDRRKLRFLWWKDNQFDRDPVDFEMTVHVFGATSSPGVVNYVLKRTAETELTESNRDAVDFICSDFYVDDGLRSVETVDQAVKLLRDSKEICSSAGFELHKFVSNRIEVLRAVSEAQREGSVKNLDMNSAGSKVERTLGIFWHRELDCLQFSTDFKSGPLTRRGLLASIYSVFDPLGLIAPVSLVAKNILQDMCRQNIGWDDDIPNDMKVRWLRWKQDITALKDLQLRRCYKDEDSGTVVVRELHHFSDASNAGLGQCSYLRQVDNNGKVFCRLVSAKSRVLPLKASTVPRLELSAAVLSAKASTFLSRELRRETDQFFWCDSKVVLGYVRNDARRFQTYVANRVQTIRDVSDPVQWCYVKGMENPADLASRGVSAHTLVGSDLWWSGPSFLRVEGPWKMEDERVELSENDPEVKNVRVTSVASDFCQSVDRRLGRYSSLHAARTGFALCMQLQERYRKGAGSPDNDQRLVGVTVVNVDALKKAEMELIRLTQRRYYWKDLKKLECSSSSDVKSPMNLQRLDPFLDSDGILRVGGRVERSSCTDQLKHPVILPKGSSLTQLVIDECHSKIHHQGRGMTLGEIRASGYWIVKGPSSVAEFIRKCVTCKRLRGVAPAPKMSSLPLDRLSNEPPFTYCGVDVFGPWMIREGRRDMKRYGVLFTCLSSRAVHIEVATSLSADSFINAFRRFVARRGPVRTMRSDRGTNFVGATSALDFEKVGKLLTKEGCDWVFNPPYSSHMGGSWERQIRTVRNIMTDLLLHHGSQLDEESLRTFLVETEAIVNGRPLCEEDLGSEFPEPLTPNHLLTAKSKVVLPPPGEFEKEDVYARKRWRRVQYILGEFWNRWSKAYMQSLQSRKKWTKSRETMKVGDIVLMNDENRPRNEWGMARVVEVFPSSDGVVRKVKLVKGDSALDGNGRRCKSPKYLERSVHKLIVLVRSP